MSRYTFAPSLVDAPAIKIFDEDDAGRTVALVYGGKDLARLFARSDEMLAALRLLDNGYKYSAEVCNIARAAIAKAEGRS